MDVDKDDGHRLVLVVPLVPERHSPDPVPDVVHSDGALGAQKPWATQVVGLRRKTRFPDKSNGKVFEGLPKSKRAKEPILQSFVNTKEPKVTIAMPLNPSKPLLKLTIHSSHIQQISPDVFISPQI